MKNAQIISTGEKITDYLIMLWNRIYRFLHSDKAEGYSHIGTWEIPGQRFRGVEDAEYPDIWTQEP